MTGYVGDTNNGPAAFASGDPVLYQSLVDKANAASEDDDLLNAEELERFMESIIPGDVSPETAQRLINIYGNGEVVSTKSIVEDMTMDGFLKAVPGDSYFSLAWGYDWDAIDGSKIGDALFRVMGLDPATSTMTAGEFDEATDRLFGDTEGLSPENADFLTRNFGTGGTLNRDQLATIFEGDHIHIDGVPGENYIRVFVNSTPDNTPFADTTQAANYIMSFDANRDGILDRNEFRAALESRMADESTLSDPLLDDYMNFYGFTYPTGDRVLDVNGVNAMLADTSLYLAPRGTDGAQGFGINLNITPIERVIRGASLDDDTLNRGELAQLFEKLGLGGRDPAQMEFLLKVYGNGDVVDVATIMGAMQEDGFLTLAPNMASPAVLNWDEINGERIAAAVFREMGVDPAVVGATVTAEQFNDGVDRLFGDVEGQTLDDAKQQVEIFGADSKMTVAQMGAAFDDAMIHIDGVAGEGYVRIAAHSAEAPDHHHESWWKSLLKHIEGGAKEAVSFLAKYGTMAEEEIAKFLNGEIAFTEASGKEFEQILVKLSADVEAGVAEAVAFVEKLGEAAKTAFTDLSETAKGFLDKIVTAAKETGEDAMVFALVRLMGMNPEDAKKALEMFGAKDTLASMAMNNTPEQWAELIPGFDKYMTEGAMTYDEIYAIFAQDPAAMQQVQDAGFEVTAQGVIHEGRMLTGKSAMEKFVDILKTLRVDVALEWNAGSSNGKLFDGLQFRAFICFKADDKGEIVGQLRIRTLEEAGVAVGPKTGGVGVDGGLVTVHDYVIPLWGHDRDVKLQSSLGFVLEGDISGSATVNMLTTEVANLIGEDGNFLPPGGLDGGMTNFRNYDAESGFFVGFTVVHNLSEDVRASGHLSSFFEPTTYEFLGYMGVEALAGGVAVLAPEVALAFVADTGVTGLHALGMVGSFLADIGMYKMRPDDQVDMSFGVSWWGAARYNFGKSENTIPLSEQLYGANIRERLQVNFDLYSHDFG